MGAALSAILALALTAACGAAWGQGGGYYDAVRFVQYLDENTALEEVRNGNIDLYYHRIPSDRLESQAAREGLQVFDSAGGSYSILVNPAESEQFNPFASRDARFALNYLIDRSLIVNEFMGGYGTPVSSYYGPADPEFVNVVDVLAGFGFRYDPALADRLVTGAMLERGAQKVGGAWVAGGEPVRVVLFIRSDDPIRKSIGELLAGELEGMGFAVHKEFGDLNKAFVVVYGSDPANAKWHLYTEGWSSSAFVRYDSVGLGQMYAPWFSNMPGFNDPSYWNYENAELDSLTQRIYSGGFASAGERTELVRQAVKAGVDESVRVFLASKTDRYVAGASVSGIVNDFGAGVPGRFTAINAQGGGELRVGVKQIYQGAWNPVMGLTDSYSRQVWNIIYDPGVFKHPFTGETIPVRASWQAETAGDGGALGVPRDAILWDSGAQEWQEVGSGATATSMVAYDFEFGSWHNGVPMGMDDILHSLYFADEWGTPQDGEDATYDAEYTPRAAQGVETIKGVRVTGPDSIEVYVDYAHFDEGELAEWAVPWSAVPWEVTAAMEQAVIEGKASFSRSGAASGSVSWLSLLVPNDAAQLGGILDRFAEEGHVPAALAGREAGAAARYAASSAWIAERGHAVISNGPFYLESYSPESRTITAREFAGPYPIERERWSHFESPELPSIDAVSVPRPVPPGGADIVVETSNADSVLYFVSGGGGVVSSGRLDSGGMVSIPIGADDAAAIGEGSGTARLFALSDTVHKPDYYEASFIVSDSPLGQLGAPSPEAAGGGQGQLYALLAIPAVVAAAALYAVARRRP